MLSRVELRNAVERVLHVKGNYRGGILEAAVCFDCALPKEIAAETAKELATALKQQSEVFQNVRLNTIQWRSSEEFVKEVTPMAYLQTGAYFESYVQTREEKALENLAELLKKFYARSKLIFLLTDGSFTVKDEARLQEAQKPFLEKKLVLIRITEGGTELVYPMEGF